MTIILFVVAQFLYTLAASGQYQPEAFEVVTCLIWPETYLDKCFIPNIDITDQVTQHRTINIINQVNFNYIKRMSIFVVMHP